MITDCPSCTRQFRIHAWHLAAAKGLVQCGFCGEQFNALERLHDRPLPYSDPSIATDGKDEDSIDEPQFNIPNKDVIHIDQSEDDSNYPEIQSEDIDDIPLQILADMEDKPSIWGRLFWGFGVITLLIATSVQIIWFNRDWILTGYPEYIPIARQICDRYSCELVREWDLSSIILLNRDVRDHPRYNNTLLVNAIIENQSDIIQPYPGVRLTLFDTEGKITGYRIFSPSEYLDPAVNIEEGIPARVPVHLVLEVTGATDIAVSFEFDFI